MPWNEENWFVYGWARETGDPNIIRLVLDVWDKNGVIRCKRHTPNYAHYPIFGSVLDGQPLEWLFTSHPDYDFRLAQDDIDQAVLDLDALKGWVRLRKKECVGIVRACLDLQEELVERGAL